MNNTPDNGTILSVDDQNQVNLLERRLLEFRSAITDAKTEKDALEKEITQIEADKTYKGELLTEVTGKVAAAQEELNHITGLIQEAQQTLATETDRSSTLKTESDSKEKDLADRIEAVSIKETKLDSDQKTADQLLSQNTSDRDSLSEAKRILLEALDKAKW